MTINERFKMARKKLGLTQTDVGTAIGMKQGAIGNIEQGRNSITDRTVLMFCKSYNVNETWLREGGDDEDMFCEISESGILEFAKEQGLGKMSQSILLAYLKMDEKKRDAFDKLLEELIINVQAEFPSELGEAEQEEPVEEPKGYHWEDFDVDEETEKYRQELIREKRAKAKSSALQEQKEA